MSFYPAGITGCVLTEESLALTAEDACCELCGVEAHEVCAPGCGEGQMTIAELRNYLSIIQLEADLIREVCEDQDGIRSILPGAALSALGRVEAALRTVKRRIEKLSSEMEIGE